MLCPARHIAPSTAFGQLICRIGAAVCLFAEQLCPGAEHSGRHVRFRDILARHDDLISRLCFGYARTKEDFEDLRQDTYVNIWQGLRSFRGESDIKTWIYRVTLNTCVSTVRRRSREGSCIRLSEFADIIDDSAEHSAMIAELHEAIAGLSDIDKALVLMWLDGMSYDEISAIAGLSPANTATRLHRAKAKLKNLYRH